MRNPLPSTSLGDTDNSIVREGSLDVNSSPKIVTRSTLYGRLGFLLPSSLVGLGISGLSLALLLISGTRLRDAVVIAAVIGLQSVIGAITVPLFLRNRSLSSIGYLGYSLVIGAVLVLAVDFLLVAMKIDLRAWWLLLVPAVLIRILLPLRSFVLLKASFPEVLIYAILVLISSVAFLPFWRENPAYVTTWIQFYADLPVHEALSHSLSTFGPSETIYLPGSSLNYHWMGNAWVGILNESAPLGPYIGLTRGLYVWALIGGSALSWSLAKYVSPNRYSGPLAVLLLAFCSYIGLGVSQSYSSYIGEISPTHTFSVPVALALVYALFMYFRSSRPKSGLVLIGILSGSVLLARAPMAMLIMAGLVVVWLSNLFQRRSRVSTSVVLAVASASMLVIYLTFMFGGPTNGLALDLNAQIPNQFGLVPYEGLPGGQQLGFLSMVVSVMFSWAGIFWLLYRGNSYPPEIRWFLFGVGSSSFLFVAIFVQSGAGQVTFLWAASVICLPMSAAGLSALLVSLRTETGRGFREATWLIATVAGGVALGVLMIHLVANTVAWRFAGVIRWSGPIVCLIVAFILLTAPRRQRGLKRWSPTIVVFPVAFAVAVAFGAGAGSLQSRVSEKLIAANSETPLAISPSHVQAAAWVKSNVAGDAIFATDRQCSENEKVPPNCGAIVFVVSSLTGRRTLIEGWKYAMSPLNADALERLMNSWRMGTAPTQREADYLKSMGVRWFWHDKRIRSTQAWDGLAESVYENGEVVILKLI